MSEHVPVKDWLMEPVVYNGQEYFTSHYFHRHYIANSEKGKAKYQRHPDFIRTVKAWYTYRDFVAQGHIVELSSWKQAKSSSADPAQLNENSTLYKQFQAVTFRALYLFNATIQVELWHHLDDAVSKKHAVASSSYIAQQMTGDQDQAPLRDNARRFLEGELLTAKLFNIPEHLAQQEAVKITLKLTGVDYRPYLQLAPAQSDIADDQLALEPTDLAKYFGFSSAQAMNKHIEHCGWQRRVNGHWEPIGEGVQYASQHAWARAHANGALKDGYNLRWNVQAVQRTLPKEKS